MNDNELQTMIENYLRAFATTVPAEQERLLHSSLADGVVYSNPGVEGSGIGSLVVHIGRFQDRFPGGHFRKNWVRQQHGQLLLEWTQLDKEGSEIATGHTYGRLNEEGRIAQLAGFWSAGAV